MSDTLDIDLTNYRDRFGERVSEGHHLVVVDDIVGDTSNAGNPMFLIYLRVLSAGDDEGRVILDRLTVTTKALFRVVAFLAAVKHPTPKKKLRIPVKKLIGRRLVVNVSDEEYNGRLNSRVQDYLTVDAARSLEIAVPSDSAGDDLDDVADDDDDVTTTSDGGLDVFADDDDNSDGTGAEEDTGDDLALPGLDEIDDLDDLG